ncbi:MAG: NADH-quinone oxidoreductase subunit J, partial [Planctomycetota bacterium]
YGEGKRQRKISRFVMETFPKAANPSFKITTKEIGRLFFNNLVLPFELISLLVVVAILGAIMLALFSRGNK